MKFELIHIVIVIVSYLIGAFPNALFIVKFLFNKDITAEGTGNIGTMNTYDITGKKYAAVIVFFLDLLKGFIAVMIASLIADDFYSVSLAAVWVILGHNFNIFLGFRGGRGLATAVGIFLAINPFTLIIWILMWITGFYGIKRDVHAANAIASLGTPVLIFSSPGELISIFNIMMNFEMLDYKLLVMVLNIIILIRHIKPLKKLFKY